MPDLKAFLDGGGEAGALIRARDWGQTPLGPIRSWPQSLRSALSICLRSPEAMAIFWGPDFRFLYNDAWSAFLGDDRHPWGLGRTAQDVMADIWPTLSGQFDRAYREGQAISMADTLLTRHLGGRSFDSYWSYSVLPIASEDGSIGGLLAQARETTPNVMRARRDRFLVDLGDAIRASKSVPDLLGRALEQLGEHLGAVRTGYGEIDPDLANFTIRRCWTRDGLADVCGRYPVGYFHRPGIAAMHAGEPIVIDDGEASGLLSEEARERWAAIGCRASMVVPVIGEGRYSAVLFVHDAAPRQWSEHEQGLVAAVADRLWQYVGRARAEEALRRSEERHRRIFEEASDIILTADLDQAITGCNPAGAAAIGLPREAILGRSISDFVSAEGFDQTSRMLRQKMEHGGTTRHEIDVRAASGRIMHWEVNSTLA
ncbi:MAG TPA: PAS domain-containing protein, partial [Allosphingosinicella sp.]